MNLSSRPKSRKNHFKARNFHGMEFSRHFNFAGFFNNFWISQHFNFAFQSKYYISWHLYFAVSPEYYNLGHFSFTVMLIIEFFMCVSFQRLRNFGENMERKCNLKYIFIFFTHHWFTKVLKLPEKLISGSKISSSSSSESTTGFINPKTSRSSSVVSRSFA